eukprot:TRINITY_DN8507_c1_g3_i1.p1 TRINITY_DN8507_c1_g3~~TRINITY_DN8507_c1_g3_i1.p1  ORF type:complete len:597 (-),score=58.92 TRINITY_DN8507_c1_g3_i1:253-2043(-)
MIDYDFGVWGVGFIFRIYGSVFPRAAAWALPAGLLAALYCYVFSLWWKEVANYPDVGGTPFTIVWGGYTFIVGFLLVFRTQIGFSRFWEGAKILWYVKGVWLNAVSNTLAFTTADPAKRAEASAFQHFLVRLMSLLFSASMEAISTDFGSVSTTLGAFGISQDHLDYLAEAPDKPEVILNWVQRLLVKGHHAGTITIPPPILSRVFQELGNGVREISGARRIAACPFPFPYAQSTMLFLILNWFLLPFIAAFFMPNIVGAGILTFCTLLAQFSITYIAAELECPFGGDPNDLPLATLIEEFNDCLQMLMHPMTRELPSYDYDGNMHDGEVSEVLQPIRMFGPLSSQIEGITRMSRARSSAYELHACNAEEFSTEDSNDNDDGDLAQQAPPVQGNRYSLFGLFTATSRPDAQRSSTLSRSSTHQSEFSVDPKREAEKKRYSVFGKMHTSRKMVERVVPPVRSPSFSDKMAEKTVGQTRSEQPTGHARVSFQEVDPGAFIEVIEKSAADEDDDPKPQEEIQGVDCQSRPEVSLPPAAVQPSKEIGSSSFYVNGTSDAVQVPESDGERSPRPTSGAAPLVSTPIGRRPERPWQSPELLI